MASINNVPNRKRESWVRPWEYAGTSLTANYQIATGRPKLNSRALTS